LTEINFTILSNHKAKSIGHGVSFIREKKLARESIRKKEKQRIFILCIGKNNLYKIEMKNN
jgi:hypothetical protein